MILKNDYKVIGIAALLAVAGCAAPRMDGDGMEALLRLSDDRIYRVSSADPSGKNADMRRVNAGQSLTIAELQGPGVITHLWFTLAYPSRRALRNLVLKIYFDDIEQPCVEAPLGDFFGLGQAQTYAYASRPLAVGTHSGLNSYWPMPFSRSAKIVVANEGPRGCPYLYYQVDFKRVAALASEGLHFFAAYRQAYPCGKGEPYVILQTDGGRGHYAGCNLSVEQQDPGWWGEGDMRIFIDGEKTPSIAGTGSEDDFGGAWCYSHEFSYPAFGAPLRGRFNTNGVLEHCTAEAWNRGDAQWRWPKAWLPGDLWNVYRYEADTPLPFRRSIFVTIEHGTSEENERGDWYSSVAYWYQTGRPTGRQALPSADARTPRYLRPADLGGGRWEAENLADFASATAGAVEESDQGFWGDIFSGRWALQWNANKPGDRLSLPFAVAAQGRYRLVARLCRNENGGAFTIRVDDGKATEPVDLYQSSPIPAMFDMEIGEADLAAGNHTLDIVCEKGNPKSKATRLLLDKIQVAPIIAAGM